MRDLRFIILLIILAIVALIFVGILVPPAEAASSGANVVIPSAVTAPLSENRTHIIEVHQGSPTSPEIIYQGETCDLTLVEGWYGIVQRNPGGETVDVSQFSHRILIAPDVFPVGTWYQWSPEGVYGNANTIAFEVRSGQRPAETLLIRNETSGETITITHEAIENLPLSPKHVADYLVACGDSLNISVNSTPYNTTAMVWIFQNKGSGSDWLYPRYANMSLNISASDIEQLGPGKYTIVVQHLNQNHVADVAFVNHTRTRTDNGYEDLLYSPFGGENTTVSGWVPEMIKTSLLKRLDDGMWLSQGDAKYNIFDDTYDIRSLVIEDQYSEIAMIDEYYRSEDESLNASIVRIAGYTNLANKTNLKIVLDYDKQSVRTISEVMQSTQAIGKEIGERRQFSILYPVYYRDLSSGGKEHSFSVINPDGSNMTASYHVYDIPAGQPKPMATLRYIGGNEFTAAETTQPQTPVAPVTVLVTVVTYVPVEVTKIVEVAPWYVTPQWLAIWVIILVVIYYLYWRFVKR